MPHFRPRIVIAVAFSVCLLFPSHASAWHKFGHMATALAACDPLQKNNPALCSKLVKILRQHPRFAQDFEPLIPADLTAGQQEQWIFCLAADWPDAVRPVPGVSANNARIPADPASRTSYHRPSWHFINFPYAIPPADEQALETAAKKHLNLDTTEPAREEMNFNAIQALKFNTRVLTTSNDAQAQAVALCWILHLIGDLHQPLHCVALFTPHLFAPGAGDKAAGDRGGNRIAWGKGHADNIHWIWDDAPGTNKEASAYESARKVADLLLTASNVQAATAAQKQLDPTAWAHEGFSIAKEEAYTAAIKQEILNSDQNPNVQPARVISMPPAYEDAIRPTANKRVVEGGFRAAAWLIAYPAR